MLVQHYAANGGIVNSVCFHPSGNFLLSTCEDSTIRVSIIELAICSEVVDDNDFLRGSYDFMFPLKASKLY